MGCAARSAHDIAMQRSCGRSRVDAGGLCRKRARCRAAAAAAPHRGAPCIPASWSDRRGRIDLSLLARRKQTTPSSVMVLEAISRVLPDTTYVTELRIEGDKVQVVGISQDAPSLVRLMEQSPQFSRATFFAPTTRAQNDPGERFHIEVHITPYFGSGT